MHSGRQEIRQCWLRLVFIRDAGRTSETIADSYRRTHASRPWKQNDRHMCRVLESFGNFRILNQYICYLRTLFLILIYTASESSINMSMPRSFTESNAAFFQSPAGIIPMPVPIQGENTNYQSPLGMDLGEFMESDLDFLNSFTLNQPFSLPPRGDHMLN